VAAADGDVGQAPTTEAASKIENRSTMGDTTLIIQRGSTTTETMVGRSLVRVGRFSYGIDIKSIFQWNEGATLDIGAFCSIARGVTFFLGGNHRPDWATTYPFGHIFQEEFGTAVPPGHPATNGGITVGNDVWIGDRATIMSGVTIGDGAVIAANAHVVKNVGPYEIWGGNPAQKIRSRLSEDVVEQLLKIRWWDFPIEKIRENLQILCSSPTLDDLRRMGE
jgi:acetyltransferase-like isoleucine patch superfamily enzyme